MNPHLNQPIIWDEELNAYVYASEGYNGPSTKTIGRIASALSLEHYKVRQLELIAKALEGQGAVNDLMRKQLSVQNYRTAYFSG